MKISTKKLITYREERYRVNSDRQLENIKQAEQFVKKRGFIFFWPIKGMELPSLWTAVAGNRPVANAHDDPGHITWAWKDESLGKKLWYYGKILRRKGTMISFDLAPFFYSLSRNFGNPEEDILIDFYDGLLSKEAKLIFEVILKNGPSDTISIRQGTNMTSKETNYPFEKAIAYLQSDFKIVPVGISDSGGWRYSFIYDLVHRHYPELPANAHNLTEQFSRKKILNKYFESVGAAKFQQIKQLFGWNKPEIQTALEDMINEGLIYGGVINPKDTGEWFTVEEVIQ